MGKGESVLKLARDTAFCCKDRSGCAARKGERSYADLGGMSQWR